jgi:hypothetical protein
MSEKNPKPHTGDHLAEIERFVGKAKKGGHMDLGNGRIGIRDGEFLGMADKMLVTGALLSLSAECGILEEVALAAAEVENPPERLAHVLRILHRVEEGVPPE